MAPPTISTPQPMPLIRHRHPSLLSATTLVALELFAESNRLETPFAALLASFGVALARQQWAGLPKEAMREVDLVIGAVMMQMDTEHAPNVVGIIPVPITVRPNEIFRALVLRVDHGVQQSFQQHNTQPVLTPTLAPAYLFSLRLDPLEPWETLLTPTLPSLHVDDAGDCVAWGYGETGARDLLRGFGAVVDEGIGGSGRTLVWRLGEVAATAGRRHRWNSEEFDSGSGEKSEDFATPASTAKATPEPSREPSPVLEKPIAVLSSPVSKMEGVSSQAITQTVSVAPQLPSLSSAFTSVAPSLPPLPFEAAKTLSAPEQEQTPPSSLPMTPPRVVSISSTVNVIEISNEIETPPLPSEQQLEWPGRPASEASFSSVDVALGHSNPHVEQDSAPVDQSSSADPTPISHVYEFPRSPERAVTLTSPRPMSSATTSPYPPLDLPPIDSNPLSRRDFHTTHQLKPLNSLTFGALSFISLVILSILTLIRYAPSVTLLVFLYTLNKAYVIAALPAAAGLFALTSLVTPPLLRILTPRSRSSTVPLWSFTSLRRSLLSRHTVSASAAIRPLVTFSPLSTVYLRLLGARAAPSSRVADPLSVKDPELVTLHPRASLLMPASLYPVIAESSSLILRRIDVGRGATLSALAVAGARIGAGARVGSTLQYAVSVPNHANFGEPAEWTDHPVWTWGIGVFTLFLLEGLAVATPVWGLVNQPSIWVAVSVLPAIWIASSFIYAMLVVAFVALRKAFRDAHGWVEVERVWVRGQLLRPFLFIVVGSEPGAETWAKRWLCEDLELDAFFPADTVLRSQSEPNIAASIASVLLKILVLGTSLTLPAMGVGYAGVRIFEVTASWTLALLLPAYYLLATLLSWMVFATLSAVVIGGRREMPSFILRIIADAQGALMDVAVWGLAGPGDLAPLWWRMLGARISPKAWIDGNLGLARGVEIGDGAIVCEKAIVSALSKGGKDGWIEFRRAFLHPQSSVSIASYLPAGSSLGADSILAAGTVAAADCAMPSGSFVTKHGPIVIPGLGSLVRPRSVVLANSSAGITEEGSVTGSRSSYTGGSLFRTIDSATSPPRSRKAARRKGPQNVFMTGATGFVGSHLLDRLLADGHQVYTLVRAATKDHALARVRSAMVMHDLWKGGYEVAIVPIIGDLSMQFMGLDEAQWERLASTMDLVVHAAAIVDYTLSFEELYPTNVQGTRTVLEFASLTKVKPLHYIGTLAVFNPLSDLKIDETNVPSGRSLHTGYTQSRYESECLVLDAARRGASCHIYRLGHVVGSGDSPMPPREMPFLLLRAVLAMNSFPVDLHAPADLTPVSHCASLLAHFIRRAGATPVPTSPTSVKSGSKLSVPASARVRHITHPRPTTLPQLCLWLTDAGYELEGISYARWRARGPPLPTTIAPFFEAGLDKIRWARFGCERTLREARAGGFVGDFPEADETLVAKYVSSLLAAGAILGPGATAVTEAEEAQQTGRYPPAPRSSISGPGSTIVTVRSNAPLIST